MRSLTPNSSQHWHLQLFKFVFGALQIVDAAVELDYIVRQRVQRVGYGQRREADAVRIRGCLLYTSPSPRDRQKSRMPSSA